MSIATSDPNEQPTVSDDIGPFAITPTWVFEFIGGNDATVYTVLRSFANRNGEAYPHLRTIAERAHLSQRTVERSISRLRKLGLITTRPIYRADGGIAGLHFHVPLARPRTRPPGHPDGRTPEDTQVTGAPRTPLPTDLTGPLPTELTGPLPSQLSGQEQTSKNTPVENRPVPTRRSSELPPVEIPEDDLSRDRYESDAYARGEALIEGMRNGW